MNAPYIEDITVAAGILKLVDSCEEITNLNVYNISSANAITIVYSSNQISSFDINTVTGTAGQNNFAIDTCNNISSGSIQNISTGVVCGVTGSMSVTSVTCSVLYTISDNCKGFNSCSYLSGCEANTLTTDNSIAYGYYSCLRLSNCTATAVIFTGAPAQGSGFSTCTDLTGCYATACDLNGFLFCTGIVNCTSSSNGTYGFGNCSGMYMNAAFSNGTKDYHTCKVDRSGAIAVSADTVASGCNDGTNYD
jgi:hypothetical protein